MKVILFVTVAVLFLSGCALVESIFKSSSTDGDRQSLGRDLGGAMQMAIEGEWIAGGIAGLLAVVGATARYFFRRGEKAEKKKVIEITDAVERSQNGETTAKPPGKRRGKPAAQPG